MSEVPATGAATLGDCPRCDERSRLRARVFSDQATAALVAWRELDEHTVGQAICDNCYDELREVMIDRADDLANGNMAPEVLQPTPAAKPVVAKKTAPASAKEPEKAPAAKPKGKGVKKAG